MQPTFQAYVDHVREISRRSCPNCQSFFCFACGERVTKERDHNGRLTLDENPLFHCANLQGVLLGVGLTMLEQEFTAQLEQSSSPTPAGNSKKRKAKVSSAVVALDDEDDEQYYAAVSKGKKPKSVGIGYAGDKLEDVSHSICSHSKISDRVLFSDIWPTRSSPYPSREGPEDRGVAQTDSCVPTEPQSTRGRQDQRLLTSSNDSSAPSSTLQFCKQRSSAQ